MKINVFSNNMLQLQGRVVSVNEYVAGKVANVTVAIANGRNTNTQFISLKSFAPASYSRVKIGTMVRIFGHISPNKYEKDGVIKYETDLVADYLEFLESKATVEARKQRCGLE